VETARQAVPNANLMRKVRYSVAASLDGYIAGPNSEYDWIPNDPTIDFEGLYSSVDTYLIGRRTYQHTGGMKSEKGKRVYVFSTTMKPEDCAGATLVSDNAAELVSALRHEQGDGDIWLFGGGDLFRSLLEAGQVDAVEVAVVPVLLGGGIPLVTELADRAVLKLERTQVYPSGIVSLIYSVPGASD
jgi:dihydrofolate reductase